LHGIDPGSVASTAYGTSQPGGIELRGVSKSFGGRSGAVQALAETSVSIDGGAIVAIVGRSGCGKSTLLRLMAGLAEPSQGSVRVGSEQVRGRPPASARFVFQDFAESLFSWKNVIDNVRFGARHACRQDDNGSDAYADRILDLVELGHVRYRYPHELSGGMQQRVAIARALASRPRFLFMDEPFSAVDALSRSRLQDITLRMAAELQLTVVLVTHDVDEAVYLADRVWVLGPHGVGVIEDTDIHLERPRAQIETRESPAFLHYRRVLLNKVQELQ
jgi:NitT/TauT family transport system ATP-binding protein